MKLSATDLEAVVDAEVTPLEEEKRRAPRRALALPDLEQAKSAVINSLSSTSGQRTYDHAITEFVSW